MPSAVNLTLGKGVHLPSAWVKALGKHYFRNGVGSHGGHVLSLPSATNTALGKSQFYRVFAIQHSAKGKFAECQNVAECFLDNTRYMPWLPSALLLALGKAVGTRQQ